MGTPWGIKLYQNIFCAVYYLFFKTFANNDLKLLKIEIVLLMASRYFQESLEIFYAKSIIRH
jgi:hypothetical protein